MAEGSGSGGLVRWLPLLVGLPVVVGMGLWFGLDRPAAPAPLEAQPLPMTGQSIDLESLATSRAPPPAAPPPPAALVMITVLLSPPGVSGTVTVAGKEAGLAPGAFPLPEGTAPVTFTVNAHGYRAASLDVVPDMGKTVTIPMKKAPPR